jgi:hypothetical protein
VGDDAKAPWISENLILRVARTMLYHSLDTVGHVGLVALDVLNLCDRRADSVNQRFSLVGEQVAL